MANRHQRRRRANEKRDNLLLGLAQAARSAQIRAIVKENLSKPIERNFYAGIQNSIALCEAKGSRLGTAYAGTSVKGRNVQGKVVKPFQKRFS